MGSPVRMRPFEPQEGLLERAGRALSLKNMIQGQQAEEQDLQLRQQEMQEQRTFYEVMAEVGGDPKKALPILMERAPGAGMKLQKDMAEWESLDAEGQIKKLDLLRKQSEQVARLIDGATDEASKNAAIDTAEQNGWLSRGEAMQWRARPFSPEYKERALRMTMNGKERLASIHQQLIDAQTAKQAEATLNKTEIETMKAKHELETGQTPGATSDVKNYQFAVSQGYKGSFEQWQKDEANRRPRSERGPTRVEVNAMIEQTAGDYLSEAGGDPNRALRQLETDLGAKDADPRLKRYGAWLRMRIRERVRPGRPAGRRDRLSEILGEKEVQ